MAVSLKSKGYKGIDPDEDFEDAFAEFREPEDPRPAGKASGVSVRKEISPGDLSPGRKIVNTVVMCPAILSLLATFALGAFGTDALSERGMEWVLVTMFGTTFFLFGIMICAAARTPFGLVFVLVGGTVAGLSVWYGTGGEEAGYFILERVAPCCLLGVFMIAGLCMAVIPRIVYKKNTARYSMLVQARVVDKTKRRSTHRDSDGRHRVSVTYPLTWAYSVNGQDYTWASSSARSPEPRGIGDTDELLVDPDDPSRAWDRAIGGGAVWILLVMGVIFFIVGAGGLAVFLLAA